MERRRISRWVPPPFINWIGILFVIGMDWFVWVYVGVHTVFAVCVFAINLGASAIGFYLGFHTRRVEIDDSHLYVGGSLWPGTVAISLDQIRTVKLHRPFPGQITICFEEKTPAGSWVIFRPRIQFLAMLSTHSDVVELQNRVRAARRGQVN